jgi:hypothetical protein
MNDHVIDTLRAADPALRMPAEAAAGREATRESILQSDVRTGRAHAAPRTARSRRVLMVALAAALLLVVIPSAAWAYFSYFNDKQTVLDEFQAAQKEMPLPAGVAWTQPDLPDDAVFGSRLGFIAAWGESTDAWMRELVAGHKAGDPAREKAAIAALERQVSLMPVHKDGDPEEAGGFVKESVTFFQGMIDKAKQGELNAVEEYLQANP